MKKKQKGLTIVELLIGIVIGILITGAVLSLFVSMVYTNTAQLKSIRLNQELRSVMTAMVRDIRRAGHNQLAANSIGSANPYALFDTSVTGEINFSYDLQNDGTVETFGYRRDATKGVVQGCKSTVTACTNWESLTDTSLTSISLLTFSETTAVVGGMNLTKVTISMTGSLRNDPSFTRTLLQTVEVRN